MLFSLCSWGASTINMGGAPITTSLTELIAKNFSKQVSELVLNNITNDETAAIKAFCNNEIQLLNTARDFDKDEVQACIDNGVKMGKLDVATDAIIVLVRKSNTVIYCLNIDKIRRIWGYSGRQRISSWQTLYPNTYEASIIPIAPGDAQGDVSFFETHILYHKNALGDMEKMQLREDVKNYPKATDMLAHIKQNQYTIGFVNYRHYLEDKEHVNAISIEDEYRRCVEPNPANISTGKYSHLTRPLRLYYNKKVLSSDKVKEFLIYYDKNKDKGAKMLGLFPALKE